jgi:hypothetical protein
MLLIAAVWQLLFKRISERRIISASDLQIAIILFVDFLHFVEMFKDWQFWLNIVRFGSAAFSSKFGWTGFNKT